jgi:hypothetical protein
MFQFRSLVMALLIAAVSASCGVINKSLTLKVPSPPTVAASARIHTLKIAAPVAGANVFVLEDLTAGSQTRLSTPLAHGSQVTYVAIPAGLKRADFVYNLESDSGPMFTTALRGLFNEDSGSSVDVQVAADFKYGLTERRENVAGGWGNTNTIGLHIVVRLILSTNDQVVYDKTYTAFESDSYSTRWVTFPGSDFLDGLFQKGLRAICSNIASDAEVVKHL